MAAIQYKVEVGGSAEFKVDSLELSIPQGPNHDGWADLTITILDKEEDIFLKDKKAVWIDWLKDCFDPSKSEAERVKPVTVKVVEGNNTLREATIKKAFIASYVEATSNNGHYYRVVVKREPDLVPSGSAETMIS